MDRHKIERAKAKLQVENPYFGLLAMQVTIEASENQESFTTDGETLYLNDHYLDSLSLDETAFMLSNAAMHRVLATKQRADAKMGWLWQLATDYAINAILVANGMALPDRVNFQKRFEGMYAEEIYHELRHEIKNEAYDDNEANESGYNESNRPKEQQASQPPQEGDSKRSKIESELSFEAMQIELEQALSEARKQGKVPESLERLIGAPQEAEMAWHELLHAFVESLYESDYTLSKPNPRYLYQGVYLPSLKHESRLLGIAIDSSASISETLLGRFMAEIEALRLSIEGVDILVAVCDAKIHQLEQFRYGEMLEIALVGGGGTDFRPVFEAMQAYEQDLSALIYFSDGEGSLPKEEPPYETLWVLTQAKTMPFGEVIVL